MTDTPTGAIQLDRTVESIIVGRRHRTDLGDIDELAASIERDGLLQPLTITIDGVLVCGARRLVAIKKLGWRTVNVWVRSGLSDRLGQLLAEQDDNVLHKPLTQIEAAALYRELKKVMAEDAARRKASAQFSSENQPGSEGPAKFAGPSTALGDAREQAAAMIPGGASHTTLEKIGYLQQIADDPAQPDDLRLRLAEELKSIDAGAPVRLVYETTREAVAAAREQRETDLHQVAANTLARAKAAHAGKTKRKHSTPSPAAAAPGDTAESARYPVRAFILTWTELAGWWLHYDATELAAALTEEQIESFLHTADGTAAFAQQLRTARTAQTAQSDNTPAKTRGHLRAL